MCFGQCNEALANCEQAAILSWRLLTLPAVLGSSLGSVLPFRCALAAAAVWGIHNEASSAWMVVCAQDDSCDYVIICNSQSSVFKNLVYLVWVSLTSIFDLSCEANRKMKIQHMKKGCNSASFDYLSHIFCILVLQICGLVIKSFQKVYLVDHVGSDPGDSAA